MALGDMMKQAALAILCGAMLAPLPGCARNSDGTYSIARGMQNVLSGSSPSMWIRKRNVLVEELSDKYYAQPWNPSRMSITSMSFLPITRVDPSEKALHGIKLLSGAYVAGDEVCINMMNTSGGNLVYQMDAYWFPANVRPQYPYGLDQFTTRTFYKADAGTSGEKSSLCIRIPDLTGSYKLIGLFRPYNNAMFDDYWRRRTEQESGGR